MRHMSGVRQHGDQIPAAGQQIGAPDDAGHRFRVHRVHGEQGAGGGNGPAAGQQQAGQPDDERGGGAVQQHVARMVAGRPEAAQRMVQLEAGHAERPVGAVRPGVGQPGAPEVVAQQLAKRGAGQDVHVAQDGPARWRMRNMRLC